MACVKVSGGATCKTRLRPHCSLAATAMACQCANFLSERSPLSFKTLLSAVMGKSVLAPSSVAFSSNQSMRSLAVMPDHRWMRTANSRSVSMRCVTRTPTSLRPMWVMTATHSPPSPLNKVISSPGCILRTCTCRAVPAGKSNSSPNRRAAGQ